MVSPASVGRGWGPLSSGLGYLQSWGGAGSEGVGARRPTPATDWTVALGEGYSMMA